MREHLAAFVNDSSVDHIGLGRFSWYQVEGGTGHRTYFIPAYVPCMNTRVDVVTVYKQQERFIQEKGLRTDPKVMFREDLLAVLQRWQEKGDRVVLVINMNEHVIDGEMCKQLVDEDLQMREVVHCERK